MNVLKLSTDLQADLIKVLNPDSTTTNMLTIIVDRAARELAASACTVFIIDKDEKTATQRAGTGYQRQFVDKVQCRVVPATQIPENPSEEGKLGLTGWILSSGKSLLAQTPEELSQHPHRSGKHDPKQLPREELRLQTFLGVPLRGLRGEVIGLIKAERRAGIDTYVQPFSVDDQILLETVARVASKCLTYLDTAKGGNTNTAITAWTRDVIGEAAATEGELDTFLDIIVNVMAAAMHADSCAIYLIDEGKKTLTQRAGIGSQAPRFVIRSYQVPKPDEIEASDEPVGLTSWIAATGQSFYARNFKELSAHNHHRGQFDPWNFPDETETECGAFLGVPLRVGGTIIGVLKVENISQKGQPDPRDFSIEAQQRFEVLAQDTALAIMRLQGQSGARYQVIVDAQPTIFEILRGGLDVPDLMQKVVTETAKLFNARACALFLKEGNHLIQPRWAADGWAQKGPEVREYTLVEPEAIKDNPNDEESVGLTVWIAVKQEKFIARSNLELRMHPHHKGTFDKFNFEPGLQCESFMGVPLMVEDKLVGVLKVETKMKQLKPGVEEFTYFSEQDELVFDLIANSAAIAIENARLLESQRLTEQIRNQPNNLLLDLHAFVKDHGHAAGTLKQAVGLLEGKHPNIARIIDNYAALLQPDFRVELLEAIPGLVTQHGEFLEGSHPFSVLYQSFADALRVDSLDNIDKLCSSRDVLADPQLLEPQFFLSEAATILVKMYGQVTAALSEEDGDVARLHAVGEHLRNAQQKAWELPQPERDIISRITDQWLEVVRKERRFHWVENPYVAGPAIDPDAGSPFFGRQDIFKWVAENLHGAHQKNVLLLHGERRMGKTSILLQLERGELGKPLRGRPHRPLCPVFVNLQRLAESGTHLFLRSIARHISRRVSQQLPDAGRVPISSIAKFKEAPFTIFEEFIEQVSNLLGSHLLVLMFDEFEQLDNLVAKGDVDENIYGFLRDKMLFLPNVTFILAGTHRLEDLSENYRGIAFNVALPREVSFMDKADARALVTQPVGRQAIYDAAAVDELLCATYGHPYLLQYLCHGLIDKMNQRAASNYITVEDVKAVIEEYTRERGSHLKEVWDQSTKIEQAVLACIAATFDAGQPLVSKVELMTALNCAESEIVDALNRLARRRLIKAIDEKPDSTGDTMYQPTMKLFCKWVLQHFPPDRTLIGERS